tara:strand:- start:9663 stop:9788 length:126 start_codon:yes stop_codon:yes gene_type:complete
MMDLNTVLTFESRLCDDIRLREMECDSFADAQEIPYSFIFA